MYCTCTENIALNLHLTPGKLYVASVLSFINILSCIGGAKLNNMTANVNCSDSKGLLNKYHSNVCGLTVPHSPQITIVGRSIFQLTYFKLEVYFGNIGPSVEGKQIFNSDVCSAWIRTVFECSPNPFERESIFIRKVLRGRWERRLRGAWWSPRDGPGYTGSGFVFHSASLIKTWHSYHGSLTCGTNYHIITEVLINKRRRSSSQIIFPQDHNQVSVSSSADPTVTELHWDTLDLDCYGTVPPIPNAASHGFKRIFDLKYFFLQ